MRTSNKPAAPNPAIALRFQVGHHWRGVGEPERSATSDSMRISRLFILTAVVALAGCSRAPVVTVTNHSAGTLSNIVVSGSGFSEHIDSIAPGGDHKLTVHPKGETGVRVAFDAGGQHVDSGEQGYFEAGGEERRIAFVAASRAKQRFVLCLHTSVFEAMKKARPEFLACFDPPVSMPSAS